MRYRLGLSLLPLTILAACSTSSAAPPAPASTLERIHALAGSAACSAPTQCHTLALGARACGGPESYLAWSDKVSDAQQLQQAARQFNAERKAQVEAGGERSTCNVLAEPGVTCAPEGKCVLRPAGGGGAI